MEQVPFDDYILIITGPKVTKLAWMVHLMKLNAEFEPSVSDAGWVKAGLNAVLVNFHGSCYFGFET